MSSRRLVLMEELARTGYAEMPQTKMIALDTLRKSEELLRQHGVDAGDKKFQLIEGFRAKVAQATCEIEEPVMKTIYDILRAIRASIARTSINANWVYGTGEEITYNSRPPSGVM